VSMSPGARLRELIARDGAVLCPGVVSPVFATLAERAGFEAIYSTGAGISNAWLGLPDLGLMGMSELLSVTGRIAESVQVPVLADIDTGYGSALNVTRTVREFERAGVAGVQIEDQANPKRCGHFDDKTVAEPAEMIERVLAAAEARIDPDLIIVARTDALATEGLRASLDRAHEYVTAGADMIFVEAPTSIEHLRTIATEIPVPLIVNMVEGGKTPMLDAEELGDMGYKVILYANAVLRMALSGAQRALDSLRKTGQTGDLVGEMATWKERQDAVDLNQWLALDVRISSAARNIAAGAPATIRAE